MTDARHMSNVFTKSITGAVAGLLGAVTVGMFTWMAFTVDQLQDRVTRLEACDAK